MKTGYPPSPPVGFSPDLNGAANAGERPIPRVIHLVCFDRIEMKNLQRHLEIGGTRRLLPEDERFVVFSGWLDGWQVVALRLPFGDKPELLRQVFQAFLEQERPELVAVLGTCLAPQPDYDPDDVMVVRRAWFGRDYEDLDLPFRQELLAAGTRRWRLHDGVSVTTAIFVSSVDQVAALFNGTPEANLAEMEDFHLFRGARERGVPLLALRAVTDRGDLKDHLDALPHAAGSVLGVFRRFLRNLRAKWMLRSLPNECAVELRYRYLVRTPHRDLDIPAAVALVRRVGARFPLSRLVPDGAQVEVVESDDWGVATGLEGWEIGASVVEEPGRWSIARDPTGRALRILIAPAWVHSPDPPPVTVGEDLARRLAETEVGTVPWRKETVAGFMPLPGFVHVQGLNSISAEPEEGLLAACTIEELRNHGFQVGDAATSGIWVYRTASVQEPSYFQLPYKVPFRRPGPLPPGRFLVATGLGPVIDPGAHAGWEADTLLLGDEQGGRLPQYLEDLSQGPFTAADVFRYEGVAQRLGTHAVALSRLDRRWMLTVEGLNALRFDPATMRQIYSFDYDRFLVAYFSVPRRRRPAKVSYLMLTSRGCGSRCSICCSGAYQPFTPLAPEIVVSILNRIKEETALQPGEYVDLYLLDSYFNRDPERVIELARVLDHEGLLPWFEFYVRHSGLQAFLRQRGTGDRPAVVRTDLIRAYKRLGIDEIVLGIDAYTDHSIRMLKTDVQALALDGETALPAYSEDEIEAILTAIQAEGLKSRAFLLISNPFLGDEERIRTFYRLLHLALRVPGFRIDFDSSQRVNELKPFPGAPLTRVAERVPGLVAQDSFTYQTHLGRLEDHLDFTIFRGWRLRGEECRSFFFQAQLARIRLVELIAGRFRGFALLTEAARLEVVKVAETLRLAETQLEESLIPWVEHRPRVIDLEVRIRKRLEAIDRLMHTTGYLRRQVPPATLDFYRLLRETLPVQTDSGGICLTSPGKERMEAER